MKTTLVLLVLSAMLAPPLLAQSPKKKSGGSPPKLEPKKDAGPSLEETQSFIKENLERWGRTFDQSEYMNGNTKVLSKKIRIIETQFLDNKFIITLKETWLREETDRVQEYSRDYIITKILTINLSSLKQGDFKFYSSNKKIKIFSSEAVTISVTNKMTKFWWREIGKFKWNIQPVGEDEHPAWSEKSDAIELVFNDDSELERLEKAIFHLCKLNGNKLKSGPF